jgi:Protein of unknown function (DUF3422)
MIRYNIRDDYPQLHSGAHRKPAIVVGSPALSRHLVLWMPAGVADFRGRMEPRTDLPKLARQEWKQEIDRHLYHIYLRIVGLGAHVESPNRNPHTGRITLLVGVIGADLTLLPETDANLGDVRADDYQVISFTFTWQEMSITVRAELHTEYWSLSTVADLSRVPRTNRVRTVAVVRDVYQPLGSLCAHLDRLEALIDQDARDSSDFAEIHQYVYNGFWEDLFDRIIWPYLPDDVLSLGSVIADFRGLVLGTPTSDAAPSKGSFFQSPLNRTAEQDSSPRHFVAREMPRHPNWAACKLEGLWPFLSIETSIGDAKIDFKKYEFTASLMLGGRAIYVTALGAQPSQRAGTQGEIVPLFYVIYTDVLNTWQIGRLVDRIHHLGTSRLAAITEVDLLRQAGHSLRVLANEVADIMSANRDMDLDPRVMQGQINLTRERVSFVQRELARIRNSTAGRLEYRIERSRYYVRQFRTNLAALRIRRIEGFQPYDVFVERRLGSVFMFVDMLGVRYDRLIRDIELLYQYIHAQSLLRVSERIGRRNDAIEDVQAVGEVILLVFLMPYYLGNLLVHIFCDEKDPNRPVWAGALLFGALLAFISVQRRNPNSTVYARYLAFADRYSAKLAVIRRSPRLIVFFVAVAAAAMALSEGPTLSAWLAKIQTILKTGVIGYFVQIWLKE